MVKVLGCSVCAVKGKLGGGLEPDSGAKPSEGCKCGITGLYQSSLRVVGSGNRFPRLVQIRHVDSPVK